MNDNFTMVAKTFQGLEQVLAGELRDLGATNVLPGRRMVQFDGDLKIMYKANLCCRTALRILKPFYSFEAKDPDELYDKVKGYDWSSVLSLDRTFSIDVTAYSDEFSHSRYVTYRVKDAIVDYFQDRYGEDKRPKVRLQDADTMVNVHISGTRVTLSLDSSGESLHKRGYRVEQTEAPINEVLAAGIILMSGWRGDSPFVDPMCGSGTFLIEAALIAANINPGIYRRGFAFERWKDFDAELFESIYNDDSAEREFDYKIYGSDISPRAIAIAERNIRSAGVGRYINLQVKPVATWEEAPTPAGVLITNPPYGERISAPDMEGLYNTIGQRLKRVFQGWHAWIIGYRDEYFNCIGLAPSQKIPLLNGALECELREFVIFGGDKKSFLASGGRLKDHTDSDDSDRSRRPQQQRHSGDPRRDRFRRDDAPRSRRFGHDDREPRDDRRHSSRPGSQRRFDRNGGAPFRDDRGGGYNRRPEKDFRRRPATDEPRRTDSENPLNARRNPSALNSITGQRPSLPPQEGPFMRERRGWHPGRKSGDTGADQDKQQ